MDFIAPLPRNPSDHSRIINFVFNLSKIIRLIPTTSDIDAPRVAEKLKNMHTVIKVYQTK